MIAVSCGTPTPATMRVVQIEPGPTPQRTAETCALISASAPSAVATLPPTISTVGNAACSSAIDAQHGLGVAVRAVDQQHVHARVDQRLRALLAVARDADRGAHAQPPELVLVRRSDSAAASRCP